MVKLKNAKEALRESEERYRLLFKTSRDAIMTLAPPSWNFTSGNAAAFELFGMKNEETFISAPPWKYSPEFQPDGQSSANKAKKMIDTAMKKGSNFFEWTHKKLNGGNFFATVLLTRINIGDKIFLQATVRDITERKKVEKKLRESEEKYRALIETTDTGFVIIDGKGMVVDANSEYVRLTGQQTLKEILGKCVVEWTAEHDKERNAEEVKKCFEQGFTRNLDIDYVDNVGKFTPIEINATVVETIRGQLIVTLCQDITERKRTEKELKKHRDHLEDMVENRTAELKKEIAERKLAEKEMRESENKYKTLFENIPQKVFLFDKNLVFISCNKSFARDKKIGQKEIAGKTDYDLFPKKLAERYRADSKRIIKSGKTEEIEDKRVINGKEFIEYTVKCPARDERGNIVGLLGISWDVTERKQAEKELQKQKLNLEQKNIALSEIITQIEVEKRKIKNDIAANVNELVFPILEKLKLKNADDKYVDLLKNHLEELVSSFGRKIREKRLNLTSREIEICNMIKGRLASKEISDLLNISLQTVEKHRKNIRRKMGIRKKDINLASFLQNHLTGILHTHCLPIQFPLLISSYKVSLYTQCKKIGE